MRKLLPTKGVRKTVPGTTYGSPENSRYPYAATPSYTAPPADTPDFGLPGQGTNTPPRDIVYGQVLPTANEAAGNKFPLPRRVFLPQDTTQQDRLTQAAGVAVGVGKGWVTMSGAHIYVPDEGEELNSARGNMHRAGYAEYEHGNSFIRYQHPETGHHIDVLHNGTHVSGSVVQGHGLHTSSANIPLPKKEEPTPVQFGQMTSDQKAESELADQQAQQTSASAEPGEQLAQIAGARRAAVLAGVPSQTAVQAIAPGAFSSDTQGAGTSPNPPTGQYPPNPTPMQGAGDNPGTGAVMPKLQVQGDPAQVYGVRQPSAIDHAISEPTSAEAILTTANQEEGGPGSGRRPLPPYGDIWEHPRHSSMEVFDRPELNSVLRNPRKEEDVLHRVDALVNQERREWNYDALTQAKSYLIAKYGMPGRSGVYPRQQVGEAHRQLTSRGYRVFEQTNNSREQQNYTNYRSQEGQVLIGHVNGVVNHVSGRPYKQKAVGESVQHPGAYDSFKGPQWVDQTNVDPRQSSGSVGQSQPMPQEEGGPGSGRHPLGIPKPIKSRMSGYLVCPKCGQSFPDSLTGRYSYAQEHYPTEHGSQ